ncbi:MAG: cyclic nucleotide-binding domain-containing protein [Elusimicrobiota bacterium]
MDSPNKLQLLKSVRLLAGISDEQLNKLGEYLSSETLEDGVAVFEEGTPGDSLYFISKGHVRIAKKLRTQEGGLRHKELAILGPGDCFGEMALIEAVNRSADAIASGETVIFKLGRADLDKWLKANPQLAMGFFAQLVNMLSRRLRTSSTELTLLFDLSHLLLEQFPSPKELLDKVMTRLMQYLEGGWSGGAYVYNQFNDEMDLIDTAGGFDKIKETLKIPQSPDHNQWLDNATYQVVFPGPERIMGFLVFHKNKVLDPEEKNEFARTLTTTARLITAALENIAFRAEDVLRSRLKTNSQTGSY